MVLEPNRELYKDMMGRIYSLPSYTGGDQGFLNSYFSSFAESPIFDPEEGKMLSELWSSQVVVGNKNKVNKGNVNMARLPTKYNADLGLYVMNSNRWPISEESIGVIHYTLGTIKPWDWWSVWLLGENAYRWQELRNRLPVSSGGWKYGMDRSQYIWSYVALLAPFCIVFYCVKSFRRGMLAASDVPVIHHGNGHTLLVAEIGGQNNYSRFVYGGGGTDKAHKVEWDHVLEDVRMMKNLQGPPWILVASAMAGNVSIVLALLVIMFTIPSQMSYGYGCCLANTMLCIFVPLFYEFFLNRAAFMLVSSATKNGTGIKTFSGKIIGTAILAALSLVFTSIGFILLGFMTLNTQ
eukprot:jgi/Picsp_1/2593/NSC_00824-R1_plant glycogenin-like starch initiation protein